MTDKGDVSFIWKEALTIILSFPCVPNDLCNQTIPIEEYKYDKHI